MKALTCLLPVLMFASCSTSSDPGEGGLFGYWATGESGYQARVDSMQGQLDDVESDNARQKNRTDSLESRKAAASRKLNSQ